MFHSLFRLFLSVFSGKESRGNDRRTSLFLEGLEDRIVPAIWIVSDLGDAGQGNVMAQEGDLRFCMNKSASGDTINFNKSGTISLTAQLPTISKNLTIAAGSQNVTIQGNGGAGGGYRIFNIVSNDTKYNVEIDNLTIKGGWANGGGGIDNYGNLTLKNDNINNNQSTTVGGGIENDPGSTLTLSGDVIENNAATNEGGGIENFGTMNNIAGTSTTIADNQAKQGGGIVNCVNASTYFVNSVYIEGNTASTGNGGGVLNETNAVFSMVDGTIGNNASLNGYGGGLYNLVGTVTLSVVQVSGNSANRGAGMYLSDGSVTNLADLTISGNHLIGNNPLGKGIYQQTGAELHMQSDVTDADDGPGGPVQGS